jgi:hypothetical protein
MKPEDKREVDRILEEKDKLKNANRLRAPAALINDLDEYSEDNELQRQLRREQ